MLDAFSAVRETITNDKQVIPTTGLKVEDWQPFPEGDSYKQNTSKAQRFQGLARLVSSGKYMERNIRGGHG